MIKRFEVTFEDEGFDVLTYETSYPTCERLDVSFEQNMCCVYLDRGAARVLAGVFARLAMGSYERGFHLHLPKDFDHNNDDVIRIGLVNGSEGPGGQNS